MATLTDHVKTQLITAGIGRNPRTAGSLPPVWHPRPRGRRERD
jgi:hypothetical protein